MLRIRNTIFLSIVFLQALCAQPVPLQYTSDTLCLLNIADRPDSAIGGSGFVAQVSGMSTVDREAAVIREILAGNVPSFSRSLKSIRICETIDGSFHELICLVACDYLAIGSDEDYLYIPLTPYTAQYLADTFNCFLPTSKMVDQIYSNSVITLSPQPIPPSERMTTIEVFEQHTDSIKQQISQKGIERSAQGIVAGHKKDIIISNEIYDPDRTSERVVIYGWHRSQGKPIQPVYNGHIAEYADYSHGIRFVSKWAFLNGESICLEEILKDPDLSALLSDEGIIRKPYYPEREIFSSEGN